VEHVRVFMRWSNGITLFFLVLAMPTALPTLGFGQQTERTKPATASDCNVELKSTDGYKELSGILKCLNDSMKKLEAKGSSPAAPNAATYAPALASLNSPNAKLFQNNTLQVELQKCGISNSSGRIRCDFQLTNMTKEDKKVCFADGSRLVTDTGSSFSNSNGLEVAVGSISWQVYKGWTPVCDTITPLSKVQAYIAFITSNGGPHSSVQFLRLDCGSGCAYEAYNVELK
jgi:hypothetical protein